MSSTVRLLRDLLPRRERRVLPLLSALMLANAALELLSIGSVVPMIAVVADPKRAPAWLSLQWLAVGILALCLVASACSALTTRATYALSLRTRHALAHEMLQRVLDRPYAWFLQRNTAELASSILNEADNVIENSLLAIMEGVVHGTVALFIVVALIAVEPIVALGVALFLGVAYLLVYRRIETMLAEGGVQWRETLSLRFQYVLEALSSVKEARLFQHREPLVERFDRPSLRLVEVLVRQRTLAAVPRLCIDALVVCAVVATCLFLTLRGDAPATVLSRLVLYIVAIWRLVPALDGLFRSLERMATVRPLLEKVHAELAEPAPQGPPPSPLPLASGIALEGVSFAYPADPAPPVEVLKEVSLGIARGACVGLTGPTGSGKTTLVDIVAGLLPPTRGRVLVDGVALTPALRARWLQSVGYVPQEVFLLDASIEANIAFGSPSVDRGRLEEAAAQAGLGALVREVGFEAVVGERGKRLSGGQRQRLGIARALYASPDVLILDEATSALDVATEERLLASLAALKGRKTMLVVSHRPSALAFCDEVHDLARVRLV